MSHERLTREDNRSERPENKTIRFLSHSIYEYVLYELRI